MEDWHIKLLSTAGLALISFLSGYGTYWLKNRSNERDAECRERERQAEYDEFKKKRRLIGSGEVERMERFEKLTSIIIRTKANNITEEDIDRYRDMMNVGGKKARAGRRLRTDEKPITLTPKDVASIEQFIYGELSPNMPEDSRARTAAKVLAIIRERGPNNLPVGYDDEGNLVEWVPDDEDDDDADPDEPYWPIMLLRNLDAIHEASEEFFEKVWWNRHEAFKKRPESFKRRKDAAEPLQHPGESKAREIEAKYGREQLLVDDFHWGMINGKLSALRWVTGAEWDFLDT